jgi:hypothetical protein
LSAYSLEPIAGTEGFINYVRSPDGRWLGVLKPVSEQSGEERLWNVSIDGSAPPTPIADWDPQWTDLIWLADGDILTQTDQQTKFIRIPSGGGSPKPAVAFASDPPLGYPRFFSELPNGRVLVQSQSWGARGFQEDIWILDTGSGRANRIVESAGAPRYVPELGHLLFTRGAAIMAAPFAPDTGTIGEPIALFDGLRSNSWNNGFYSLSPAGHLLFEPGGRLGLDRRLVTVGAKGDMTPFAPDARSYEAALSASPDGRRAAVTIPNARGTYETWVATLGTPGVRRAVALSNADASGALWSPDGQWLGFDRNGRDNDDGVYVQRADGSGSARAVLKTRSLGEGVGIVDWTQAGVVAGRVVGSKRELLLIPMSPTGEPGEPTPLLSAPGLDTATFSPDGTLLAYVSHESGRTEVSVVQTANGSIRGAPIVVSAGAGFEPVWSADGRRLYFRQPPGRVMVAAIERAPVLKSSTPQLFLDLKPLSLVFDEWTILPDDRLLGIKMGEGEGDLTSLGVILNWVSSIRTRLGR